MRTPPKSPAAIKDIGSLIYRAAIADVSNELGVTPERLRGMIKTDESVRAKVDESSKGYMESGRNFAMSKL